MKFVFEGQAKWKRIRTIAFLFSLDKWKIHQLNKCVFTWSSSIRVLLKFLWSNIFIFCSVYFIWTLEWYNKFYQTYAIWNINIYRIYQISSPSKLNSIKLKNQKICLPHSFWIDIEMSCKLKLYFIWFPSKPSHHPISCGKI